MSFKKIESNLVFEQNILQLTLDAPKGNVLDIEMISELTEVVETRASAQEIKAIIFKGTGEHFSYGASIPEHKKEVVGELLSKFHTFFRTLIEVGKPCFALVRGQCLGGGLELAAFCHWIFAAEEAMFGQPEIRLAVFPPVASLILPHRIGQSAADDLILSGRSVTAQAAQRLGLVHSVSANPEKELHHFIAEHILPKSAAALHFAVRSARHKMHQTFLRNIDPIEALYVRELMQTHDANEGIAAFLEKRDPLWKNR